MLAALKKYTCDFLAGCSSFLRRLFVCPPKPTLGDLSAPKGTQNESLLPFRATCSHFKWCKRAHAYSNIQQNYETKGLGPRAAPVSRITSQTHSPATKPPLCTGRALELAAGATARLTGLDSAGSLPDLCGDLLPVLPL